MMALLPHNSSSERPSLAPTRPPTLRPIAQLPVALTNGKGVIGEQLQADLDRLTDANIPVDIRFTQGVAQLGL